MNNRFNSEDKIILAIDGLDVCQAKLLLEKCPNFKWVKVGLELFVREGPRVIEILKGLNKKIFLDLKFHDIPNTMRAACFQVSKLGVDIISIHASAGLKALKDSKKASLEGATSVSVKPPFVVGITVLTSFSLKDLWPIFNSFPMVVPIKYLSGNWNTTPQNHLLCLEDIILFFQVIFPFCGFVNPLIISSNVVFPEPLLPQIKMISFS